MHVKYQLNRDIRFVKIVKTKKIIKLHKFTTCDSNFEKLLLSDIASDNIRYFFFEKKNTTKNETQQSQTSGRKRKMG